MKYYGLFDKKSNVFRPQIHPNANNYEAMRSVSMALKGGDSVLAQFPEDFALYCIGEFDIVRGTLDPAGVAGPVFVEEVSALVPDHASKKEPGPAGKKGEVK